MSYTDEIKQGLGNESEGNKMKFLDMLRVLVNKGFVFLTPTECKNLGINLGEEK